MKARIIISFIFMACVAALTAQPTVELRERIYVQTDKKLYLSGELIWMKMVTTTDAGAPLTFSKVGYVELLDATTSKAHAKLELRNGAGAGTLLLPANLPTGCYRLVGYTRYMQNESPDVFFEKIIGVVNPVMQEVPVPEQSTADIFPSTALSSRTEGNGTLSVATDNRMYAPRERVELRIDRLPENIHTLSVSVAGRDYTYSFAEPGLEEWQQGLASLPKPALSSGYLAEYEGHIVSGQLIDAETGRPTSGTDAIPLLSFPGNEIQFFHGKMLPDGDIMYVTQRTDGYTEAVTSLTGTGAHKYHVELTSPFIPQHAAKGLPLLDLTRIDKDRLLNQSIGLQVQYSFVNDSLMRFDYATPNFFESPDKRYIMEEYTKFGTMEEVITEFVTFVRFRNIRNRLYLTVLQDITGFVNRNALVLLDGIPINDHTIIHQYNPLLLERIDVYYNEYIFGSGRYEGIVAMYTEGNRYPELAPDPFTRFFPYESPQARRVFYSPDYEQERNDRLPDYRHTLYWNPDVKTGGQAMIVLPFYTSDLTGDYRVTVEGMTKEGEVVYATSDFQVR